MENILLLGVSLTVLNILYILVGFFGSSKESEAAKSVSHGTQSLPKLAASVEELTQQATEVAARAERISEKKRGLLEKKLRNEAEAAVEAVAKRERAIRVKERQEIEERHALQNKRLSADHAKHLNSLKAKHQLRLQAQLTALEDQLTVHFASVLAKVSGGNLEGTAAMELYNREMSSVTPFKFQPPSSPPSSPVISAADMSADDDVGGGGRGAGSGFLPSSSSSSAPAESVSQDHELVCTADSLVSVGNELLEQAISKLDTAPHRHSFSTHDSESEDDDVNGMDDADGVIARYKKMAGKYKEEDDEEEDEGRFAIVDHAAKACFQEAESAFRAALVLNSECVGAAVGLAAVDFKFKCDTLGALRTLRNVLDAHPRCGSAHFHLSDVLGTLGRFGEARRHLEKAAECDPYNECFRAKLRELSQSGLPLENVLLSGGEAKEAMGSFHSTKNVHLKAVCVDLLAAGDRLMMGASSASSTAAEAMTLDDDCLRDAARAYQAVLALDPRHASALAGSAEACLALGCPEKASDAALNTLLSLTAFGPRTAAATTTQKTLAKAYSLASGAFMELNLVATSALYLKRAVEQFPANKHFQRTLAALYSKHPTTSVVRGPAAQPSPSAVATPSKSMALGAEKTGHFSFGGGGGSGGGGGGGGGGSAGAHAGSPASSVKSAHLDFDSKAALEAAEAAKRNLEHALNS